jgi:hypothetical protein
VKESNCLPEEGTVVWFVVDPTVTDQIVPTGRLFSLKNIFSSLRGMLFTPDVPDTVPLEPKISFEFTGLYFMLIDSVYPPDGMLIDSLHNDAAPASSWTDWQSSPE